jgi:hypothetical protein
LNINAFEAYPQFDQYNCDNRTSDNFKQVLAVNGNTRSAEIAMYPSVIREGEPAMVNIKIGESGSGSNATVFVGLYSSDGRKVADGQFVDVREIRWVLPELAAGGYLVDVRCNEGHRVFRVTKL